MSYQLLNFIPVGIKDKYVLVSHDRGSCFVCDHDIYCRIKKGTIDEELALKLHQSHIISIDGMPEFQKPSNSIEIKPVFFLIDITKICNLECIYCFREHKSITISYEVLIDILDYIYSYCKMNKLEYISIQPWGGEPIAAIERIRDIYDYFLDKDEIDCKISVETNGTLITPQIARALREMKCGIGISLDGFASLHDLNRPTNSMKGSFSEVHRGINCLLQAGYSMDEIGTILTLTSNNIDYVEEIIDYFHDTLRISKFKMNCAFLNPIMNSKNKDILITPADFAKAQIRACEKIFQLLKSGKVISESNIIQKGRNILYRNKGDICKSQGCQGGYRMVAFDAQGNIFPCNLTDYPEIAIGSIYTNVDLQKLIFENTLTHSFFKPKTLDECNNCPWFYFCKGGCRSTSHYAHNEFLRKDEYECRSNHVLYPFLIDKFLDHPEIIQYFERGIS